MIDDKISTEKDILYYDQVKHFTNNFSFLRDYSEIAIAATGARGRKFTDKESYYRYCNLREILQEGDGVERLRISNLLRRIDNGDKRILKRIDDGDKRILEARREAIEREKSKNAVTR